MLDDFHDAEDAALRAAAEESYRRDLARAADELVHAHRADPLAALEERLVRDSGDGGLVYLWFHGADPADRGCRTDMPEAQIRAALHRAIARDPYRPVSA